MGHHPFAHPARQPRRYRGSDPMTPEEAGQVWRAAVRAAMLCEEPPFLESWDIPRARAMFRLRAATEDAREVAAVDYVRILKRSAPEPRRADE